ncbi:MAG: HEAT repeat domain-containing protein [Anaerolineales bacterium]
MDFNLQDLTSPNWQQRRQAVERLLRESSAATLHSLLRVIKDQQDDLALLNAALQILQRNALPVIAGLVELLHDEDTDTRIYAAQALGQFRHSLAIPPLVEALQDPDPNVRYHAIDSLGQLQAVQAVPMLRALLHPPDFFLSFAALQALARIGDSTVVPDILSLLEDDTLGSAAAEALGALGTPKHAPALLRWMESPMGDLSLGCAALTQMAARFQPEITWLIRQVQEHLSPALQDRLLAALPEASEADQPAIITVLGLLESPAVYQALLPLLARPALREVVSTALMRHGRAALPYLLAYLPESTAETRLALIVLLGRIGDACAVPALTALLSASETPLLVETVNALAHIGAPAAFEPLLALLRHPSGLVRRAAVAAINSLGHPEHTARLLSLCQDPDPRVRAAAIDSLGYFADPQAVAAIIQAASDPVETVRLAAIRVLGTLDAPEAPETLLQAAQAASPTMRAAAMQSLALLPPERALPVLARGCQDEDDWVRLYACRSLGLIKTPQEEILPLLLPLAQHDPMPHVRITAIEALGAMGSAPACAVLTALLADCDADISEAALKALVLTDLPEAIERVPAALQTCPPETRLRFVDTLSKSSTPGALALLCTLARQDDDFEVRFAALQGAAGLRLAQTPSALVDLLAHSPDEIQAQNACITFGMACLEPLLARLPKDRALRRRAAVVLQVWAPGAPRALDALLNLSRDAEAEVRLAAANTLALQPDPLARSRLQAMLVTDPAPQIRAAVRRLFDSAP